MRKKKEEVWGQYSTPNGPRKIRDVWQAEWEFKNRILKKKNLEHTSYRLNFWGKNPPFPIDFTTVRRLKIPWSRKVSAIQMNRKLQYRFTGYFIEEKKKRKQKN